VNQLFYATNHGLRALAATASITILVKRPLMSYFAGAAANG
jgi:hypothetical protein